jgi:hypothetical protein
MRNHSSKAPVNAGGQAMCGGSKFLSRKFGLAIALCIWATLGSRLPLAAQQPATPSPPGSKGYPVTVEGHEAFRIYEALGPLSAHDRAERASERLTKLLYTPGADITAIAPFESEYGTEIKLGDQVLTIVTDDDASHMHVARAALAKYYASQVRNTVVQARQERSGKFLVRAAAYAAATLLLYVLVVWLVVIGSRRLLTRLQRPGAPLVKGIKIQQSEILAGQRLAAILAGLVRLVRVIVIFLLTLVFLGTEFKFFPWTRVHGRELLNYVLTPLRYVGMGIVNYLPKLFYIIVIVAVMYYVLKFVRILAREFERGNIRIRSFYPEWIKPTYNIIRFLLIAFTAGAYLSIFAGREYTRIQGHRLIHWCLDLPRFDLSGCQRDSRNHSHLHPWVSRRRLGEDR